MKIEILGRHIEIDDKKVNEVFKKRYESHKDSYMSEEVFIECILDYCEHSLEKNILFALDSNMGIAISAYRRIAANKYYNIVTPFNKPACEMKNASKRGLLKDDERFLEKINA